MVEAEPHPGIGPNAIAFGTGCHTSGKQLQPQSQLNNATSQSTSSNKPRIHCWWISANIWIILYWGVTNHKIYVSKDMEAGEIRILISRRRYVCWHNGNAQQPAANGVVNVLVREFISTMHHVHLVVTLWESEIATGNHFLMTYLLAMASHQASMLQCRRVHTISINWLVLLWCELSSDDFHGDWSFSFTSKRLYAQLVPFRRSWAGNYGGRIIWTSFTTYMTWQSSNQKMEWRLNKKPIMAYLRELSDHSLARQFASHFVQIDNDIPHLSAIRVVENGQSPSAFFISISMIS